MRQSFARCGRSRFLFLLAGLVLGGCMGSDRAQAQGPEDPDALLREGRYDEAIELLQGRLAATPGSEASLQLGSLLHEVGRLDRAETVVRDALAGDPGNPELHLLLGRMLLERGRWDEADREFQTATASDGAAALLAEMHRGELLLQRGEREAALELFDRFIDVYNRSARLDSRELQAVAGAVRHLGVVSSVLFQDALRAYDEALAEDPDNVEALLGLGTLFLERYNVPEARAAFRDVLGRRARHPLALLGMALAAEFEGSPDATALADQALEVNPSLVPALVLRARLHLAAEDGDAAERDLERALEVNPASSEALAVQAATAYLRMNVQEFERVRDRALELNPRDAGFFVQAAELLSRGRLYGEAAELAGRGAALDSLAWDAYGVQGLNQLRIGEMEAGRENLEIAFAGDPFNVWIKNTLDLLDLMDDFEGWESELVHVFVDPDDGGALAIYMTAVAEEAYRALSARYRYAPEAPVRVEAFRRSADFSVRTMGLTGIGALGVSFGAVLAMDSPAARGSDGYHWATTLWHEMVHAVHLGMTEHRVPRWLSEGLAVHEERRARPGWGMRPSLPFFAAYLEDRLRPPSELSRSFVRPRFPEEVGFAYVLGSLVAEWMEEAFGFDAVLGMLAGYRDGLTPERVLQRETGLDFSEFDGRFDNWFQERYSGALAAAEAILDARAGPQGGPNARSRLEERVARSPEDVEARLALAHLHVQEDRPDQAIPLLHEARDIFPDNPDPRGPSWMLARIHRDRGDDEAAAAALQAHLSVVAGDYAGQMELAEILEERGDAEGAARALEEAIFVYPFEVGVHERLATLYRELDDPEGEVRERRVLLALNPPDRAGALHGLAEAELRAGRPEAAMDAVLRALELAPRFPEAQDLLLRIMEQQEPNGA